MYYAIYNGEKSAPIKKSVGLCELCSKEVISKCGEIKAWHWAHKVKDCDSWSEGETNWHLAWKSAFGKNQTEITIEKEGVKHRADILTKDGVVIEVQHSPISTNDIEDRQCFYDKLIWVFDGFDFKDKFDILINKEGLRVFINNDKNNMMNPVGRKNEYGISDDLVTEINTDYIYNYKWSWPKRSWEIIFGPIFIDFGSDYLFYLISGNGTSEGIGKFYKKSTFFKKYGGNYSVFKEKILTR